MEATHTFQTEAKRRKPPAIVVRKAIKTVSSYTLVVIVGLLFLLPWIWLLSTSLKPPSQILEIPPRLIPKPFMWINYFYAVTHINFFRYLLNTMIICVSVLIGRVFSCTVVAYGLSHINWPGKGVLFAIVLGTMMLPGQVTMIPIYVIFSKLGWIDTFWPLIFPSFFGDAFFIFMMRQFFMTIPRELIDAAILDGANHFDIYSKVILPLSRPALATLVAFTFIWTFTDFQGPLIYLKDRNLWTLSLGMRGYLQRYGAGGGTAMGAMMAAATLYTLPMIVIFLAAQRTFIRGIITTGFK